MSKTNKIFVIILITIIVLVLIILTSNKNKEITQTIQKTDKLNPLKEKYTSQENEGGNVTVTVKPKILKAGEKPIFEVEFNTHSVDLSFDIEKLSFLTNDKGKTSNQSVWNGSPPGGHHRSGTLAFTEILSEGKFVELVIKDVAGIPKRSFKWQL